MAQGVISYFSFIYSGNYSLLDCWEQKLLKLYASLLLLFCCTKKFIFKILQVSVTSSHHMTSQVTFEKLCF